MKGGYQAHFPSTLCKHPLEVTLCSQQGTAYMDLHPGNSVDCDNIQCQSSRVNVRLRMDLAFPLKRFCTVHVFSMSPASCVFSKITVNVVKIVVRNRRGLVRGEAEMVHGSWVTALKAIFLCYAILIWGSNKRWFMNLRRTPVWITSIPFRTFYLYFLNVTILRSFFFFFRVNPRLMIPGRGRGSDYGSS